MDALDVFFKGIVDTQTKLYPLKSLHIPSRILTKQGKVGFLYEGDELAVQDGQLIDSETSTHVITSMRGTISNTIFEITVMDLNTRELSIVKM